MPPAARVGVPLLPAALASALASLGSASYRRITGAAIERARKRSDERVRVLEGIARYGAAALNEEGVMSELTAAAGRAARGLLTRVDLASIRPVIVACDDRHFSATGLLTVPWGTNEPQDASFTEIVAAADARGLVAIACYEDRPDGLPIPALGLVAPAMATPVKRGEPRVRPGEPLPAAAPIGLRAVRGVADLAVGVARAATSEKAFHDIARALLEDPKGVAAAEEAVGGRAVAVMRVRESARVLASA